MSGRENPGENGRMLLTDFSPHALRDRHFAGDSVGAGLASILDLADSLGFDFEDDPSMGTDMPPGHETSRKTTRKVRLAIRAGEETEEKGKTERSASVRDEASARPPPVAAFASRRSTTSSLGAKTEIEANPPPASLPGDDDIDNLLERAFGAPIRESSPSPARSGRRELQDISPSAVDEEQDIFALLSRTSELAPSPVKAVRPIYGGLERIEDWYEPPPEDEREKAAREKRDDWYEPPTSRLRNRPVPSPSAASDTAGPEIASRKKGRGTELAEGAGRRRPAAVAAAADSMTPLEPRKSYASNENAVRSKSGGKDVSTRFFAPPFRAKELSEPEAPCVGDENAARSESGEKDVSTRFFASLPGTEDSPESGRKDESSRRFNGFDSFDVDSLWEERVNNGADRQIGGDSWATPESRKGPARRFDGFDSFDIDSLWERQAGRSLASQDPQPGWDSSATIRRWWEEESKTIRRPRQSSLGSNDTTAIRIKEDLSIFFDSPAVATRVKKKKPAARKKPGPAASLGDVTFFDDPEDAEEQKTGETAGAGPNPGEDAPPAEGPADTAATLSTVVREETAEAEPVAETAGGVSATAAETGSEPPVADREAVAGEVFASPEVAAAGAPPFDLATEPEAREAAAEEEVAGAAVNPDTVFSSLDSMDFSNAGLDDEMQAMLAEDAAAAEAEAGVGASPPGAIPVIPAGEVAPPELKARLFFHARRLWRKWTAGWFEKLRQTLAWNELWWLYCDLAAAIVASVSLAVILSYYLWYV